jgi:DNA-binding response OmpR family regulator
MGKTVWIIDDDQSILEVLRILLEQENYHPVVMSNGAALDKELSGGMVPDIIVIDVHIAGLDGREVVKEIKRKPKFARVPVLIMTADIHIKEKSREAKADGYVKKPFEMKEFIRSLNKYTKNAHFSAA